MPHRLAKFALCVLLLSAPLNAAENAVSFRHDVMPVLSKAGCNLGTCHGNKNGKGGFRLSLRGQSPAQDFEALTRDLSARRVNPLEAKQSLILRKPTLDVPHEGGKRFEEDSLEYGILKRWIEAGLPQDPDDLPRLTELTVTPAAQILFDPADKIQLHAEALFSDGTKRDVTRLAVYEPAKPIVLATPGGEIVAAIARRNHDQRAVSQSANTRAVGLPARPARFRVDGSQTGKRSRSLHLRQAPTVANSSRADLRRHRVSPPGLSGSHGQNSHRNRGPYVPGRSRSRQTQAAD